MALTELQLPTKDSFYAKIRGSATQMDRLMIEWENLAEFVGNVGSTDLDAMGVASGQVRTDLNNFKILMDELVAFYKGSSTTQTNIPAEIVDKIRSM